MASPSKRRARTGKETLFLRLVTPDNEPFFDEATARVGAKLPDTVRPRAVCAMRVTDNAVLFSLRHIAQKSVAQFRSEPLRMPHGPLSYLQHRLDGEKQPPKGDTVIFETDEATYRLSLAVDDKGEATLSWAGEEVVEPDLLQTRRPLRTTLIMPSPATDRTLAIGFIGHLERPDSYLTVTRAASRVLASISLLPEFQTLSTVERVHVPSGSNGSSARVAPRTEGVRISVPVSLYDVDPIVNQHVLVATGHIMVSVALEGRMERTFAPSPEIEQYFEDYRSIAERTVEEALAKYIDGEHLRQIETSAVLAETNAGDREVIKEALEKSLGPGVDLSPDRAYGEVILPAMYRLVSESKAGKASE